MDDSGKRPSVAGRIFNPYGLPRRSLVLYHVLVLCVALLTVDRIAAWQFRPQADSQEIVLVSSQACPHSRAVRARLLGAGIPFREVDSEANPVASAFAAWAFQSLSVPIVVVGPEIIYGNRSDRIGEALASLGFEEPSAPVSPKPPGQGEQAPPTPKSGSQS